MKLIHYYISVFSSYVHGRIIDDYFMVYGFGNWLFSKNFHVPTAKSIPTNCMIINTTASAGRIPACEYVNILAKVTCGFANIVLDVVMSSPPTINPIINAILSDW